MQVSEEVLILRNLLQGFEDLDQDLYQQTKTLLFSSAGLNLVCNPKFNQPEKTYSVFDFLREISQLIPQQPKPLQYCPGLRNNQHLPFFFEDETYQLQLLFEDQNLLTLELKAGEWFKTANSHLMSQVVRQLEFNNLLALYQNKLNLRVKVLALSSGKIRERLEQKSLIFDTHQYSHHLFALLKDKMKSELALLKHFPHGHKRSIIIDRLTLWPSQPQFHEVSLNINLLYFYPFELTSLLEYYYLIQGFLDYAYNSALYRYATNESQNYRQSLVRQLKDLEDKQVIEIKSKPRKLSLFNFLSLWRNY